MRLSAVMSVKWVDVDGMFLREGTFIQIQQTFMTLTIRVAGKWLRGRIFKGFYQFRHRGVGSSK